MILLRTTAVTIRSRTLLIAVVGSAACGDGSILTDPQPPEAGVTTVEVVAGSGQRIWSGRRSAVPFRIRALDGSGAPVPDAEVTFRVTGSGGGDPSQPVALTDPGGYAESWLYRTWKGEGTMIAEAGVGRAELPFVVDPAAGEIRFLPGTGEVALPGYAHPDSVLTVLVSDTEGQPLAGHEVWFVAPGLLSQPADTTDEDGTASVRLRRTRLAAGGGDVYAFILAFPGLLAHDARPLAAPAERVVLVSVDGLRADAAERWSAPTLLRLASEGASQQRASAVSPSLTTPGHLSLLSGVGPEAHGVYGEALEFTPEMAELEPVFKYAAQRGRKALAFVSDEGPLAEFETALACRLAFGLDSLYLTAPSAVDVVAAAAPALADPTVDLIFLHLPDPDVAGHRFGFGSPQYGAAVRDVDSALEGLRATLSESAGSLLVITSDHGGGGAWGPYQHGSTSAEDMEVPLLLWGSRVVPGELAGATVLDVAPTVLWALGISPPSSYEGRVLLEGFR